MMQVTKLLYKKLQREQLVENVTRLLRQVYFFPGYFRATPSAGTGDVDGGSISAAEIVTE